MSEIDEIKTRLDIVDIVTESGVQLRRSGKSYTGFCPFHSNTRTPAFAVFPDSGSWRCFGECSEGGDIFSFVMKKEGWDFGEALRYLADKAGVELRPLTPEQESTTEEYDHLRELLETAVTFYRHQLNNTPAGKLALDYLRQQRGLTDATIEAFDLGYAPDSWDATSNYLRSKGYSDEDLQAVGMVNERESGGFYDKYRHRVIFPIRDQRARMAGFGARILRPDDVPKFLNSPQTALFDKSRLLYGLDRARRAIRAQDQVVIVEGYLDVIAVHQAGFENVVSPMGTALSEQQLYLLKRYSRRVVLALDPDSAGDKATLRGLQVARQTLDRESDPVFDARGLMGYERRLQADIRVSALPEGLDPDEVVNRDADEWRRTIESARPVVVHVMETLAQDRDLDDPKVKTEIAEQVLPLIADAPNAIERDAYRQRLARLLRVDERSLLDVAPAGRRPRRARRPQVAARAERVEPLISPAANNYALESHCLGVLLRRPDLLYRVDRQLQDAGLSRLEPQDFQHADHQAIVRLFQQSVDQDMAEPLNYVFNSLDLSMMELADELLERTTEMDPNEDRVMEDLMRGLLDLRRRNLHQEIEYQLAILQDAQEQGDLKPTQSMQTMVQLVEAKKRLDQALQRYISRANGPASSLRSSIP